MNAGFLFVLPVIIPVIAGLLVYFRPEYREEAKRVAFVRIMLCVTAAFVFLIDLLPEAGLHLFSLTPELPVLFQSDGMAKIFITLVAVMWLASGFFSFEYMKHEENHQRYYLFFLCSFGVLVGLGLSANYLTMYMFYELMTLLTMPLVLHSGKKEAVQAAFKYLFYSVFGALMGLLGFFFIYNYGTTITFTAGGVLDMAKVAGHENKLLAVVFLVVLGFGTKAGMFPLHAWLPTAHPVAPAPASAVLSGVITKAGILGVVRVIYYLIGPDFIRGTWVQYAWLGLALATVFMGSMMAYKEKVLKKRLAYSTVSQVSYVMFGLAVLNQAAFIGAILHVVFHSFIKDVLFLAAGAIIYKTGRTNVTELKGIGKEMPIVMWCFALASLGLVGIPPLAGFVSKWYLAVGSLESGVPFFNWFGPVILLASALLTAGYLLTIVIDAFFPGSDFPMDTLTKKEPSYYMTVPLIALTFFIVWLGLFPGGLYSMIESFAASVF
ncbi:MAG: proton-conducting membrane transporter [Lachnospiraceae bacterium]|nr:proton-conducting membrane transporter [Lachnospiraceae bacterium]